MLRTLAKHKYTTEQMQSLMGVAIDELSSGLVISDYTKPDNPLIFINPAFERMTGYTEAEVLGKNCRFLQGGDTDQPEIEVLRRAVTEGTDARVILKNYTKGGCIFWNELIVSPVHDATGKVTNFVGIQTDVTERVETQRILREKTKELELSNRDLAQFAHAVSHDLKEPLRMISTFIEFLANDYSDKLDNQAQEYIGYALNGARRMQTLIEDLLQYSKLGSRDLDFEEFSLQEALEEVLLNLQILFKEKNVQFTSANLPIIKGIRPQITTLLQNLISNAIKYTKQDLNPIIQLDYTNLGKSHLLRLQDNGIGIDTYYQDYVFEIFNRLHSKKDYPGNGVGLAICKRIIERHNGAIWFESEKDKGTSFFVRIPLNPEEELDKKELLNYDSSKN
jgi:PAS domain S-box-containing protein